MAENLGKTSENDSKFNLNLLLSKMLKEFSLRSKDIIIKRFGLDGMDARTLNAIGKEYGITRERIRQIEAEAVNKLKSGKEKYGAGEVFNYIKKEIENHGGLMSVEKITELLFGKSGDTKINRQTVLLFLSLDEEIKKSKETKIYEELYFCKEENILKFERIIRGLEDYFKKSKKSASFDEILKLINEKLKDANDDFLSSQVVESYLDANKIILKNILDEWGYEKWPSINPKNIKDKIYLVLKKEKNPLHFTEITDKTNGIWKREKRANKQTVHNELIKDERFVLIGRGIYALKECGYQPGAVLDIVIDVLKERGREGAGQEEIIKKVLKKRRVKRNTIIINLRNKKYFEKLPNKIYRLKQI